MHCGLITAFVLFSILSNANSCGRQDFQLQVVNSRPKTLQFCVNETLGETMTVKVTAGGFVISVQGTNCSTSQVLLNTSAGVNRVFISPTQITTLQQCSKKTDQQGLNLTFIIVGVDYGNTGDLIAESGNNSLTDTSTAIPTTASSTTTSTTSTSVSLLPSSPSQQPNATNPTATSTMTAAPTTTAPPSTTATSFGIFKAMPSKVVTLFALSVLTFVLYQSVP
jgi:hypothetical protein